MRLLVRGLLAAIVLAAGVSGVAAQELTEEQTLSATEFATNNTWFVLYHELGHMLVHQFGIPVLGKEEDAVDNIATYMLLAQNTPEADQALTDAIYGWELFDQQVDQFQNADFYDQHSFDLQRAYAITCLMVGDDPEGFADTADGMGMDKDRQESCADDYDQVDSSIAALLSPYEGKGKPLTVAYDDGGDEYGWAEEALKKSGVLEKTAADISSRFKLPKSIPITATACGESNAFYDPETETVTVCYELVSDYFDMIANDMLSDGGDTGTSGKS